MEDTIALSWLLGAQVYTWADLWDIFIVKSLDSCSALINKSQGVVNIDVSKFAHTRKGNREYDGNGSIFSNLMLMGILYLVWI